MVKPSFLLSVDCDDWYHNGWIAGRPSCKFNNYKTFQSKYGGEGLRKPVRQIIKIFKRHGISKATFFVQGEIAEEYPDVIELLNDLNFEIASHDLLHFAPVLFSKEELYKNIKKSCSLIRKITKEPPIGYRAPNLMVDDTLFSVLKKLSFTYDSSICPSLPISGHYGNIKYPQYPHMLKNGILEFPITVSPFIPLPAGSAWVLRNIGLWWVKLAIKWQLKKYKVASFFFHPYEVSNLAPYKVPGLPFHVLKGIPMLKKLESLLSYFASRTKLMCYREYIESNF
ncbi:polysaccharide deacetylase family protein [Candidatus Borrarchaeum sp.]|uniref:polysaccharide deacetylase family protein n=1 Tax=Candidatus Borrarchaeum sp. TaxID=2846742 RepID=UPI00258038DF|nr:polysaccharide deacetylase family protein [Candidatus Borrarchaeum sp.]